LIRSTDGGKGNPEDSSFSITSDSADITLAKACSGLDASPVIQSSGIEAMQRPSRLDKCMV